MRLARGAPSPQDRAYDGEIFRGKVAESERIRIIPAAPRFPDRLRLPLDFAPERLAADLANLSAVDWTAHFVTQNYNGDWSAIALRGPAEARPLVRTSRGELTATQNRVTISLRIGRRNDCGRGGDMWQYHDLMEHVLRRGVKKTDRTGTGTLSVFGHQMRFDLSEGFPLLTTKKLHLKSIVHELLWFLKGGTNIAYLKANGVRIWDKWADTDGELGPVYGHQWRSWPARDGGAIDQIAQVVDMIRRSPDSRRLLVTAWNPADVERMALPPCHCLFQFYVANGELSCQLYQRSADIFLGVPFNIASYALLTMMVAQVTGLKPGEFIHTLGNAHLYLNHLEQAELQLARTPYPPPIMRINPTVTDIFGFVYEDFTLDGYQAHPHIKALVSV